MVDISIRDAHGVPDQAHFSLRVGDTRRQMAFKPGGHFRFDAEPNSFVIDVFQKVGSAQIRLQDLATGGGPGAGGAGAGGGGPREGTIDVLLASGSRMKVDLRVTALGGGGKIQSSTGPQEAKQPQQAAGGNAGDGKHHGSAVKAKGYLDSHAVQKILQGMVHHLLEAQPEEPLDYMVDYLQARREERRAAKADLAASQDSGFPADGSSKLPSLDSHYSLVTDVLKKDPSLYERLSSVETPLGVKLAGCIKSGIDIPGSKMLRPTGLCAGDAASFEAFRQVFDPVVTAWHRRASLQGEKHPTELTIDKVETNLDSSSGSSGGRVLTVFAQMDRNLDGFRFPTTCSFEERAAVEKAISLATITRFRDTDLAGDYLPLRGSRTWPTLPLGMSESDEASLRQSALLFGEPQSASLVSAGFARSWPHARGIFRNRVGTFAVWVNETNHIRFMTQGFSADLRQALEPLFRAERELGEELKKAGHGYARNERLGFLCTEMNRLGTALTVGAVLKLTKLSACIGFQELCQRLGLAARWHIKPGSGVPSPNNDVWEVSKSSAIGTSEVEQVTALVAGCRRLLELEGRLEKGEAIDLNAEGTQEAVGRRTSDASRQGPTQTTETDMDAFGEDDEEGDGEADGLGDNWPEGFPVEVEECPEELPDLSEHHTICAEVLRSKPSIFKNLRSKSTPLGVSFGMCIKPGIDNPGHAFISGLVGLVAGDEHCYTDAGFRELFDEVIANSKKGKLDMSTIKQIKDMDTSKLNDIRMDSSGNYVKSVTVKASRNFTGLRFPPACSADERRESERLATRGFIDLAGELRGEYEPLRGSESYAPSIGSSMTKEREVELRKMDALIEEPDSELLLSSGYGRNWPDARGVYLSIGEEDDEGNRPNNGRRLRARINEEDHVRIDVTRDGDDIAGAFRDIVEALGVVEKSAQSEGRGLAYSERLGFLTSSPATVGTALSFEVALSMPRLAERGGEMKELLDRLDVTAKTSRVFGNRAQSISNHQVYDIMNHGGLGISEVESAELVIKAVRVLIALEQRINEEGEAAVDLALEPQRTLELLASSSKTTEAEVPAKAPEASKPAEEPAKAAEAPKKTEEPAKAAEAPKPTEESKSIAHGLGNEEYPGFPADACPEKMPALDDLHSFMADTLKADPSIYERLKSAKTRSGVTFAKCVKPGFDTSGNASIKTIGAVAGDAECYDTFADLFGPIVRAVRGTTSAARPPSRLGSWIGAQDDLGIDGAEGAVVAVRARGRRNLARCRFPPAMALDERIEVERVAVDALGALTGDLSGEYFALPGSTSSSGGTSAEDALSLERAGLLFHTPSSQFALSSGWGRDWPQARGVFRSANNTHAVWVNEEDHLILSSTQAGHDLAGVLGRLSLFEAAVRASLEQSGHSFAWSEAYGFLTTCPSQVGSGARVEAQLSLPQLSSKAGIEALCGSANFTIQREKKDRPATPSSRAQLLWVAPVIEKCGDSLPAQVAAIRDGIRRLVDVESRLANGENVDFSAPP